jgi:hypothetical protein
MDTRDIRSTLSLRRRMTRTRGVSLPSLIARAMGRALGLSSANDKIERLEERQLLEGSFTNPLPLPAPDVNGRVVVAGDINPALVSTNNDTYRFVAPTSGFVAALADTSNEAATSTLDTAIEIWNASGTQLIASGTNNGQITSGFQRDGWANFIATQGTEYRIVVKSDPGSPQGTYTLRMRTSTTTIVVGGEDPNTSGLARPLGSLPSGTGDGGDIDPIVGELGGTGPLANRLRQDEIIYQLTLPNEQRFNSLVTVNAMTTQTDLLQRLDTHLDIYDANGVQITGDEQTGRINNAFTAFKGTPGATYFIRVRSDEVRTANKSLAVGTFFLQVDALPTEISLDLLTRRGQGQATQTVFNPATPALNPALPEPVRNEAILNSFVAQGSGQAIITLTNASALASTDIAVRLYNDRGELVAFNDNFAGRNPQLDVTLVGNQRYFLVTDFFSDNNLQPVGGRPIDGPPFRSANIFIEANHTFTQGTNQAVDDHVDSPFAPSDQGGTNLRRDLALATPLPWGTPRLTLDGFGNPLRDRGLVVDAVGEGRIYRGGDTDLFQFTAPYDMLATYQGNDDDQGTSLYIGGAFDVANPNSPFPTNSRNVTAWDASDFWYTGDQRVNLDNEQLGFVDNEATDLVGAEVYVMYNWTPTQGARPRLVVGGDFTLRIRDPLGNPDRDVIEFNNLVEWAFNANTQRYEWTQQFTGNTDGPVFAITEFDPVAHDNNGSADGGNVPDLLGRSLIIGGSFTVPDANIVGIDPLQGAFSLGGTVSPVRALATYDAPDPGEAREQQEGPPPVSGVDDTPDSPISLYIGGDFGLARWSGDLTAPATGIQIGTPLPNQEEIVGSVRSLAVFEVNVDGRSDLDQDPDADATDAEVLFIGGDFSVTFVYNAAGPDPDQPQTVQNFVMWGLVDELQDPQAQVYEPKVQFANPLTAATPVDGVVNAMTIWNPLDLNGVETLPRLVVGGEFEVDGNNNIFGFQGLDDDPDNVIEDLGSTDGPVFALDAFIDSQEPDISTTTIGGPQPQEVLYVGGRFTDFGGTEVANVALRQADRRPGTAPDAFFNDAIGGGVDTDPVFTAGPAAVFALADFDDGIAGQWDRHDRPATRLDVTLTPTFGAATNFFIRVFDSQGNFLYENDTIAPPFPDPAGMNDPSLGAAGGNDPFEGITVWGGETYYIEVSATGAGRYNLSVTADAGPTDVNGDGVREDINALGTGEIADEGRFTADPVTGLPGARELATAGVLATGDTFAQVDTRGANASLDFSNQFIFPSANAIFSKRSDQGLLQTIDDTDLYFFRAEFTGTAEIRVGTTDIVDEYITRQFTPTTTTNVDSLTKTYSSRLDAALRVFGNDFVQIGYSNDNAAQRAEGRAAPGDVGDWASGEDVGTLGGVFRGEDPYLVIPVVSGQTYFIQVESGQRWRNGQIAPPVPAVPVDQDPRGRNIDREIDWRRAAGSYQLLVNAMPQQFDDIEGGNIVIDDHFDVFALPNLPLGALSTPIAMGQDPSNSATNGRGSITGVINNTPQKPVDVDLFRLISPGNGTMTVRLTRATGSTLNGEFTVARGNGAFIGSGVQQGGGALELSFAANAGETFFIDVAGQGISEGAYEISVSGVPFVDDFADANQAWRATDIVLSDFSGTGVVDGAIEQAGDTDIFRFEFRNYDRLSFVVQSADVGFNPRVTIYEVTENNAGEVIFLRVGVGEPVTPVNNDPPFAQTVASVTPNRSRGSQENGDFREYPFYYVVVEGENAVSDVGEYTLTLGFNPDDDHADADTDGDGTFDNGQAAQSTPVLVDALTGTASINGNIEVPGDTDLLRFTLEAEGNVSVTLTRGVGSFLRARLSLLKLNVDGTFTTLAQTQMADAVNPNFITASFDTSTLSNVNRGENIYIAVDGIGATTNINTGVAGTYVLTLAVPPLDDHANRTEWNLATIIPIDGTSGRGQVGGDFPNDIGNPRISPAADDDLFTFTVVNAGVHNVTLTPFVSTLGTIASRIRVFRDDGSNVFTLIGTTTSSGAGQAAAFTINNATAGQRYFVLVDAVGLPGANPVGEYRITVQGPAGTGGGGGGNDPSTIDFNNPTTIVLNPRTGDGSSIASTLNPQASLIQPAGDRDLYAFTTAAAGRVFLRLSTPAGSVLDAQIQVLRDNGDGTRTVVATDADGLPGSTAQIAFGSAAGIRYFVIVDGLGESVGAYQLEILTEAAVKRLVYPEGFASDSVSEFVPIVNPNVFPVDFRLTLYYDDGTAPTQLPGGTMQPNSRDGYTINAVINGQLVRAPGVIPNKPYSVVLDWTVPNTYVNAQGQTVPVDPNTIQPLGATLSHYDFGSSTGDAFTDKVAPTWTFPRVERNPGAALNFILFFNPQNYEVDVSLTAFLADGSRVTLPEVRRVRPLGREGFAINDFAQLGNGVFGVQINSTPVATTAQLLAQPFEGVVASITAYRFGGGNESAFGALGDAQGGTTKGAITNITNGNGVASEVSFFNPGNAPATVTLSATYIRNNITASQRTIQVPAGRSVIVTGASLGLVAGDAAGIRYTSDLPVSVLSYQAQRGDADASTPQYEAGTRFMFGDAFINGATAGRLYFETLYFYNPSSITNNATINIVFYNEPGTTPRPNTAVNISIPANGFQQLRLHELQAIVGGGRPSFFGIDITGALPFQVTMEHYDLFLGGGWAASPVPFGIRTPLSDIN